MAATAIAPVMTPSTAQRRRALAVVDSHAGAYPSPGIDRSGPVRVVVADHQALVRAGLHALLDVEEDIVVVGEAADADQAVALSRRVRPDVILLDAGLPPVDGVEATQRIAAEPNLASIPVVMLTGSETDEYVFGALRAGVRGFLLKDAGADELGDAVRAVADGEGVLSPGVARRLMEEFAALPESNRPRPEQLDELTPRELEVVALVAMGMSNLEIAQHLVVSAATAKTHVSRALRKLDARDRSQLVTLAYETGLVVPRVRAGSERHAPALVAV
jgi:DNA-binding NarL/FixJ family response regulator